MSVQQALEWAFCVEHAQLELPDPPDPERGQGFGFGLEYVLMQRAALGCKIDGGQLLCITCLGLCHHFIAGTEWLPVKLHLACSGIPLSTLGCSHFVYLDPDHWRAGHTSALTEAARRSNPAITHTLSHSFNTPALETWAAKLPGMKELDIRGPNEGRVFVRAVG